MKIIRNFKILSFLLLLFISQSIFAQGFYEEILRYNNGRIKSIITYNTQNIKDGPTINYYSNGMVKNYIPYENGKISGIIENYFSDGILESTGMVLNDIAAGKFEYFHSNGKSKFIVYYDSGKLSHIVGCKNAKGDLLYCGPFNNGNGEIYIYDEKGILLAKDHFKKGEFIKREIVK